MPSRSSRKKQSTADLRARAEKALSGSRRQVAPVSEELARLVHELQVHQVELEIQNDELRAAETSAEEALARYEDLFQTAPIGYLCLDGDARILEANATAARMFGTKPQNLRGKPFSRFVAPADQDAFYFHRCNLAKSGKIGTCEVRLRGRQGLFDARLQSARMQSLNEQDDVWRIAVVDIGDIREAEQLIREARDSLERRVRERTLELESANRSLRDEMSERRELEAQILKVSAHERFQLGRDLHDGLCQYLFGANVLCEAAKRRAGKRHSELEADLDQVIKYVQQAEQLARNIAAGLCPFAAHADDLAPALRQLCEEVHELFGITCSASLRGDIRIEDPQMVIDIYRIARESVINAVRHGNATRIRIAAQGLKQSIRVAVTDNGQWPAGATEESSGLGIKLMRYQADLMGGELHVTRSNGSGTTVTCRVPRKPKKSDPPPVGTASPRL